jgi:hypothetical protein
LRPEDLLVLLRTRPFAPFRIHLTDGQTYEIVHPEAVFVMRSRAMIGLRPDPVSNIPDQSEQIPLLEIVRISEIPVKPQHATQKSTGQEWPEAHVHASVENATRA